MHSREETAPAASSWESPQPPNTAASMRRCTFRPRSPKKSCGLWKTTEPGFDIWAIRLWQPRSLHAVLLRNRDKTVQEWQWRWRRRGHVFEDTRLEVASSFDIDLEARLALVEQAEREPSALAAVSARARLPRMAEGWGA